MHVRKGDTVLVIAGNDKGKQGTVRSVDRDKNRVVVEGVNVRWKHQKPSQKNPKGERTQREAAIHASNVMHFDPDTKKPLRYRPEKAAQSKKGAKKKTTSKTKASKETGASSAKA